MTKWDLFLKCKDGLTYEKQWMKWGKYHTTILSIVTDKTFGKSSTLVFILGGSKITADDDCSHEIKRCLLLGRKVMTNLEAYSKAETLLCQQRSIQSRLWFFQWSCMDARVGLWRKLSTEELMLLNWGVGEDSWESLGLQGDPTSPFWRRSALGFLWKEWC